MPWIEVWQQPTAKTDNNAKWNEKSPSFQQKVRTSCKQVVIQKCDQIKNNHRNKRGFVVQWEPNNVRSSQKLYKTDANLEWRWFFVGFNYVKVSQKTKYETQTLFITLNEPCRLLRRCLLRWVPALETRIRGQSRAPLLTRGCWQWPERWTWG